MSPQTYSNWLECDGECGSKIELTSRDKKDVDGGIIDGVAELLGWTTRDRGKKQKFYCPFCQRRARHIVEER